MRTTAVIEIAPPFAGDLPFELIEAAYRASATGEILLVLPRALRGLVDGMLDPIVESVGPTAFGIRYAEPTDDAAIRSALGSSKCAVASSPEFRSRCQALGVSVLGVAAAIVRLRSGDLAPTGRVMDVPSAASSVQQVAAAG